MGIASMALETPQPARPMQSSERTGQPVLTSKNLSIIVVGLVLITAMIRADSKDVPQIVKILVESNSWAITGWILALIELIAGVVLIKLLMRFYEKELKRVAQERDNLQIQLLTRPRE